MFSKPVVQRCCKVIPAFRSNRHASRVMSGADYLPTYCTIVMPQAHICEGVSKRISRYSQNLITNATKINQSSHPKRRFDTLRAIHLKTQETVARILRTVTAAKTSFCRL